MAEDERSKDELQDVEVEEEREEGVGMDVECVLPLYTFPVSSSLSDIICEFFVGRVSFTYHSTH